LYDLLANVYIGKYIFTNLMHVMTKAIRSTIATVIRTTMSPMYIGSFSVKKKEQKQLLSNLI